MRTSWVIGAAIVIVALHMLGVLDTVAVFVLKAGAVLAVAVLAWIILARPRRAHSRTPGLDRLAHSHRILRRRGHLDREHGKREPGYAVPVSRLRPPPPGMHHVIEVVDGDTIRVDWDGITETLRLIGVDAPETKHPDKPVEYFRSRSERESEETAAWSDSAVGV
ncbi:MAG: hypothetical protein OXM03_12385 [Chloroflexota bacterium]|nr:hypothetical protein [Chloroflexota bacterium]MDE2841417.1 hypothetical protein [Chloroflexota bacterium]